MFDTFDGNDIFNVIIYSEVNTYLGIANTPISMFILQPPSEDPTHQTLDCLQCEVINGQPAVYLCCAQCAVLIVLNVLSVLYKH